MTLLQREALVDAMAESLLDDRLIVTPLLDAAKQVGPGSIDLRLGPAFIEIRRRDAHIVDPFGATPAHRDEPHDRYEVPIGESLFLHPGQFLLGSTFEFIKMPARLAGQVLGRSSWGRLGLIVATAVTVQPGFAGCLTLELQNLGSVPIRLFPGLRVAQLTVWEAAGATSAPYSASPKYDAPLGPESSRIGWELDEVTRLTRIGQSLRGGPVVPTSGP